MSAHESTPPTLPAPLPAPAGFAERVSAEIDLAFDEGDLERLGRWLALLIETTRTRFNLTAIVEPEAAWERHVFDSLTLVPFLAGASGRGKGVLDLGSGGGAPGIPLAIVMPDVPFALLEATGKKARYLEEAARLLELANVTVIADRAESVAREGSPHREAYGAVVARAVGTLPVLIELALPLLEVGGLLLAVKGERATEEIAASTAALRSLRADVIATRRTPTNTIVAIEKRERTLKKFPRQPGEAKGKPL